MGLSIEIVIEQLFLRKVEVIMLNNTRKCEKVTLITNEAMSNRKCLRSNIMQLLDQILDQERLVLTRTILKPTILLFQLVSSPAVSPNQSLGLSIAPTKAQCENKFFRASK